MAVGFLASGFVGLPAQAVESYDEVVEIVFPTDPDLATFSDDYDGARSGGRRHMATDLIVPKHTPAYAAADGVICYITGIDEPEPTWGYHLKICGDDGTSYDYVHLNNDTPGTDDGQGGPEHAYVEGIDRGVRVSAGQHIAWIGDSGNAEHVTDHLHFEMEHPDVTSPYDTPRMNPYPSLVAALEAGRIATGAGPAVPASRVAGSDRVATALAVAAVEYDRAGSVVLARSDVPWPAIVGGPLAATLGGPVLTTPPGHLDDRVRDRLADLRTTTVHVIGPLDIDLEEALEGTRVNRIVVHDAGDREATAAAVAEVVWEATGATSDRAASAADAPLVGEALPFAGDLGEVAEAFGAVVSGEQDVDDLPEDLGETVRLLQQRGPQLVAVATSDRRAGVLLDGASVRGDFAVQVLGVDEDELSRIDFWYDTTERDGDHDRRERFAPYDAPGANDDGVPMRFALDAWGPGEHVITIEVRLGDEYVVHEAWFEVADPQQAPPEPRAREAILALGDHPDPDRSWPDALMASYLGAARGVPILLARPDQLSEDTVDALAEVEVATIVGGPAAISEELEAVVEDVGADVVRLAGENRYATGLAVTQDLVERDLVDPEVVWLATGHNWPDATAVGPVIAGRGEVLVLVNGLGPGGDDATHTWLRELGDRVERLRALGGPAAVATSAIDAAIRAVADQE